MAADSENSMESSQPSRATMASVDARVARLEQAQADTDGKIGLIQLEQTHTRELMTARFTALEVGQASQTQKLDQFISRIETMILEATRSSGDLTASPAGRQVHERLTRLETKQEIQESLLDQAKGMATAMRWVIGSSLLGLVLGVLSLLTTAGVIGGN